VDPVETRATPCSLHKGESNQSRSGVGSAGSERGNIGPTISTLGGRGRAWSMSTMLPTSAGRRAENGSGSGRLNCFRSGFITSRSKAKSFCDTLSSPSNRDTSRPQKRCAAPTIHSVNNMGTEDSDMCAGTCSVTQLDPGDPGWLRGCVLKTTSGTRSFSATTHTLLKLLLRRYPSLLCQTFFFLMFQVNGKSRVS